MTTFYGRRRVQGWHVTNDGISTLLHLTLTTFLGTEEHLTIAWDPEDACDAGRRMDEEIGEIDAQVHGSSGIDDHDRVVDERADLGEAS